MRPQIFYFIPVENHYPKALFFPKEFSPKEYKAMDESRLVEVRQTRIDLSIMVMHAA